MKQLFRLGMVALSVICITPDVFATSSFNIACPQKFIAAVTNVEDVESQAALQKVEVDFQVIQTLKGEKLISKKIQVVKGGPIEFKSGEIYTVESNEGWLCSAAIFSKV
jgi:hypothetical protein